MTYNGLEFGWPLDLNIIRKNRISNTFGMVRVDTTGHSRAHQGWDFSAKVGTPCYAAADGKVVLIYESVDYGNVLVLFHERANVFSAYCHLLHCEVAQGSDVSRGSLIARTGDTGNAFGLDECDQHLHFEFRLVARPGKGLENRISPFEVYGICPLKHTEKR